MSYDVHTFFLLPLFFLYTNENIYILSKLPVCSFPIMTTRHFLSLSTDTSSPVFSSEKWLQRDTWNFVKTWYTDKFLVWIFLNFTLLFPPRSTFPYRIPSEHHYFVKRHKTNITTSVFRGEHYFWRILLVCACVCVLTYILTKLDLFVTSNVVTIKGLKLWQDFNTFYNKRVPPFNPLPYTLKTWKKNSWRMFRHY